MFLCSSSEVEGSGYGGLASRGGMVAVGRLVEGEMRRGGREKRWGEGGGEGEGGAVRLLASDQSIRVELLV